MKTAAQVIGALVLAALIVYFVWPTLLQPLPALS